MNTVTAKEIAIKLYRRHPIWLKGKPVPSVEGTEGAIGKIVFTAPDKTTIIGVFVHDKTKLEQLAQEAINNFGQFINEWIDEHGDD